MDKSKTHVIMIVDESGSMFQFEDDVIGGFNGYIATLKEDKEYDYYISLTKFDDRVDVVYTDKLVAEVPNLDNDTYRPSGMTALYDAIGKTLQSFKTELPENDRVIVVINTDGAENSSREFNKEAIKQLILERQEKGWTFLYLGQHLDSFDDAEGIGILRSNTVMVANTSVGNRKSYGSLAFGTMGYSRGLSGQSVASDIQADQDDAS